MCLRIMAATGTYYLEEKTVGIGRVVMTVLIPESSQIEELGTSMLAFLTLLFHSEDGIPCLREGVVMVGRTIDCSRRDFTKQ